MNDDQLPPLDDYSDEIKSIQYNKPKNYSSEDYTKVNTRHIEDQEKQKQQIKQIQKKVQNMNVKIEVEKEKKTDSGYGGFKKGFLGGGGSKKPQKREPKIQEVKVTKKSNPLQIKQVQEAMKMNNYLEDTKKEWMTGNFLDSVTNNEKINKLFTNPEYMKAIDLFKTNPKEAMAKYGSNKQFMQGFQQFCKMMGMQFQNLAGQEKKK